MQAIVIKNILDKHAEGDVAENETDNVKLHVNLDNLSSFNKDRRTLHQIVKDHVKPCIFSQKIKLCGYFKPLRLSSIFSRRSKPNDGETTRCVYKSNCSEEGCQASYVGFTWCKLNRRIRGQRKKKSVIYKHFYADHSTPIYLIPKFESNFRILCKRYLWDFKTKASWHPNDKKVESTHQRQI